MTTDQIKVLNQLRDEGYAIIVWTPEELKDAPVRQVENRSIELGHDIIRDLQE